MTRAVVKWVTALGLLLLFLQLAYGLAVRRYVDGLAAAVAPVAQLRYERVESFPLGRFGVRGLSLAVHGRPDLQVRAEQLRLRSSDPISLLGWMLAGRSHPGHRLVVQMEGIQVSPALLGNLRRHLGPVGFTLPFEGMACTEGARLLTARDYQSLGWHQPRWDLQLRLDTRTDQRRLELGWQLDRQPPGSLHGSICLTDVEPGGGLLRADLGGARVEQIRLVYQENGLLAQRNVHCTNGGGRNSTFVQRHRQQLHAWLRELGMVPDEPVWEAYGAWLAQGGEIELTAHPIQAIGFDEYPQFAPEDRLRLLGLRLRTAGLSEVPVEAASSGVLLRNGFRALPDLSVPESVSTTPAAAVAEPSMPAPARRPRRVYHDIGFSDLAQLRGQRIRVTTSGGNRHNGMILDITDDAVELQITRYGGGARLPIARSRIQRIELAQVE